MLKLHRWERMGQGHRSVLYISDFLQKQNMQGSSPKFYMSFSSAADLLKNLNFILMEWLRKLWSCIFLDSSDLIKKHPVAESVSFLKSFSIMQL